MTDRRFHARPTDAPLMCFAVDLDQGDRRGSRYAGLWQVLSPDFSTTQFLAHTKTFHALYEPLTSPAIAPYLTFAVGWGDLLIGLSLMSGLLVRVSGVFGMALLLTYWTAHMDFPYIESHVNLMIDYHIVYIVLVGYLVAADAGHAFGVDGWVAQRFTTAALTGPVRSLAN